MKGIFQSKETTTTKNNNNISLSLSPGNPPSASSIPTVALLPGGEVPGGDASQEDAAASTRSQP